MEIFRIQPSKLSTLSQVNPNYWTLCVSRSQYNEEEIKSSLAEIEKVNDEWQSFQDYVWTNILTDADGEMGTFTGYASDTHRKVCQMLVDCDYVSPSFSQNSHDNCFPVNKWNKEISSLRSKMAKIQKLVNTIL
jgi:hypothetical protein